MGIEIPVSLDWRTIAFAAAGISVFGSAMLIILSRFLNLRNLEQTAKVEFVYAASTVFIVLMTIGLLGAGEFLMTGITKCIYLSAFNLPCNCPIGLPPDYTLIDYMKLYMETPVQCAREGMYVLYVLSIPVESVASVYMEVFMSEPATGFGAKAIAERLKNTTQMLTFYIYIYYVLVHAFNFIEHFAGLFFAIGVVMRAFPPVRGAGAYLMAASIGFYLIFPFSYILVASIALPHAQGTMFTATGDCDLLAEKKGSPYYICILPEVPKEVNNLQCGSASQSKVFEAASILKAYRSDMIKILDIETGFVGALFKNLLASVCFAPLIAIILMMTFILNTTNLFGGNIPEIGRGLVKLI